MSRGGVCILSVLVGVLMSVTLSHALSCVLFQANTSWSPCPGMTNNKDIHLDQLSGRWFLHQTLKPSSGPDPESPTVTQRCMVMTPHKTDTGFLLTGESLGEHPWQNNITYNIPDPVSNPGLWDEIRTNANGSARVVARSQLTNQDGNYLVFALCPSSTHYACNQLGEQPTFLVWGRNATADSLNLEPINNKIRQMGISYVKKAEKIDTSACYGFI